MATGKTIADLSVEELRALLREPKTRNKGGRSALLTPEQWQTVAKGTREVLQEHDRIRAFGAFLYWFKYESRMGETIDDPIYRCAWDTIRHAIVDGKELT